MNVLITFLLESQTYNDCTTGKLYKVNVDTKERTFIALTLERPWQDNQRSVSCIPAGEYVIKPVRSPKFGSTYYLESLIKGEVGLNEGIRTHILFHAGNTVDDTNGCILLGNKFGVDKERGARAIWNSKKSLNKFLLLVSGYEYRLKIIRR